MFKKALIPIVFCISLLSAEATNHPAATGAFAILVEHFEDSSRPSFDPSAFQGREWDLSNLLNSFFNRQHLQSLRANSERTNMLVGGSYCLEIRSTRNGNANGQPLSFQERKTILGNLITQLHIRQSEMKRAGAIYRIHHPSTCASQEQRMLGRAKAL